MNPTANSSLLKCMCYCSRAMLARLACSALPLPHFVLPNLTLPCLFCLAMPHFVCPCPAFGPHTIKNRLGYTLALLVIWISLHIIEKFEYWWLGRCGNSPHFSIVSLWSSQDFVPFAQVVRLETLKP